MLTTQQFANLCDTTKKTILYYDRIGLIKPCLLTPSGRKYEIRQVLRFQKITLLKSFGFSLDEILTMIDCDDFAVIFKDRVQKLEEQQEKLSQKLKLIQGYLKNLKSKQFLINPKVKTVGPYRYYAIRKAGRYVDISQFNRELATLIQDLTYKRVYFTAFLTDAYAPDQSDMTIGAFIEEENPTSYPDITIEEIPKQKVVTYTHLGSYRYLSYVWQYLNKYTKDKGYCVNRAHPCRELYIYGGLVEENEDKLITELQVPIMGKI